MLKVSAKWVGAFLICLLLGGVGGFWLGVQAAPVTSWSIVGDTLNIGKINANTVRDDDIAAGRIVYGGTAGLLSDDAGLTYDAATDTLTVGNLTVGGVPYFAESEASFVVWTDAGLYYAKDGHTGAVTSNANAATLINSLITAVNANDGGLIFFKKGIYTLTSSILLLPSVSLQGEGAGRSGTDIYTLFVPDFNGYAINATEALSTYYASSLKDFRIECDAGVYAGSGGIYFKLVSFVYIENVRVWGPGQDAFFFDGACANIYLRDCYSQSPVGYPYHIDGGTHIDFDNCISDSGTRSVFINTGYWINIVNSHFETPSGIGIYAVTGHDLTIAQTKIISAGTEGIRTQPTFSDVTITTITVSGQASTGIHSLSPRTKVIGCSVTQASAQRGIHFEASDNGMIVNNIITGSGDGMNINVDGDCNNIQIIGNQCSGNTVKSIAADPTNSIIAYNIVDKPIINFGATDKVNGNIGFVTENSGTATLLNGQNHVHVTHGLSYTPTAADITITFTELPTNASTGWYVGDITATEFQLHQNDPGASNLDFSWSAHRTP